MVGSRQATYVQVEEHGYVEDERQDGDRDDVEREVLQPPEKLFIINETS